MTYRRTWFSCVLWFMFTVLCVVLIGIVGRAWIWFLTSVSMINPQIIYGVLVIPVAALYWMIRSISSRIRKKWVWKERTVQISTFIVFALILAFAVIIRIIYLNYYGSYIELYGIDDIKFAQMDLGYFDQAVLVVQGSVSLMDYGISYLYVMLLSVVLSFLGIKVVSAVFLQICLQVFGMLLAYAVARKMTGRLPACISILYLAGSLTCLGMLFQIGPEWLYFILYMIGMLIAASFVRNYCANNIPKLWAVICAVVVGALIGVLTYLDLIGASLLIVILIAAVGKKSKTETAVNNNYSKGINAAVIVCSCIACAAVCIGIMCLISYVKGTDVVSDIVSKLQNCYLNIFPYTGALYSGTELYLDIYWISVLIVPASFLVFEYFRSGKEQNYMPWIMLCLLVAPTPMAMYGEHGFLGLSLYVWAVLAGLGLQNCIYGGRAKVMQAVIEETNMAAEKVEQSTSVEQTTERKETGVMKNQTSQPHFIENPLPLPRKHVAKEMDYMYTVDEKDMKYDVEVPEDDDFDLQ